MSYYSREDKIITLGSYALYVLMIAGIVYMVLSAMSCTPVNHSAGQADTVTNSQ